MLYRSEEFLRVRHRRRAAESHQDRTDAVGGQSGAERVGRAETCAFCGGRRRRRGRRLPLLCARRVRRGGAALAGATADCAAERSGARVHGMVHVVRAQRGATRTADCARPKRRRNADCALWNERRRRLVATPTLPAPFASRSSGALWRSETTRNACATPSRRRGAEKRARRCSCTWCARC